MSDAITRREATLRTAAVAALCALAITQLAALPYALVQGPQVAVVSAAAIAAALGLAAALATAGADGERAAWRTGVALGVLTAVGWVVTRAVAVPGVAEDAGHWTTVPGLPAAGLGIALAVLGAARLGECDAGAPRGQRGWRRVRAALGAAAMGVALAPAPAIALAAFAPAPVHHHGTAPASVAAHPVHAAAVGSSAAAARFRPGFGGHAGRYVYANARRPHVPPWALTLALAAAAAAVSLAAGALRRRVPAPQMNAALQRRESPARPLDRRPAVRQAGT